LKLAIVRVPVPNSSGLAADGMALIGSKLADVAVIE
jgi:hypothetical protein